MSAELKSTDLKLCPFCGAGETQERPINYWTGMSNSLIAFEIHHWCADEPKHQSHICKKGKTREEAVERWNRRVLHGQHV